MTEHPDPPARPSAEPTSPGDPRVRQGAVVGQPYGEAGTFARGDLVIGRFKILRYIARGGAGEVYEALDTELRCPVALKVVRPELAANQAAMERFRREIALARQVTHPNVCRIFDVFRDSRPAPGGGSVETLFLTMELLVGETLAERLRRKGPLQTAEALPLIEDMVAALEAAHRAGVIHRDFKSANVVLAEEGERPRAVITDFGLAQVTDPDDPAPLTQSGTVVGTPNYMAPEQITGDVITPAADQYALGIVIYEMLTGLRPFRGSNDLSTAVKRLTEPAPSPRSHLPDLDPRWEQVVLRCLERSPKDRFDDIDDVREALTGRAEVQPLPSRRVATARRGFLVAAAAILVLALAAAFRLSSSLEGLDLGVGYPGQALPSREATIAIFDFRNLAGEPAVDWLSTALPEMINMELAAKGDLAPTVDSAVARVAAALELGGERDFDREAILDIRRQLRADHVVEGSYLARPEEDGVRLHLRVYDDGPPRRILVVGRESQLADVVREASSKLRAALGLASSQGAEAPALPADESLLLTGREELRKRSYQGARKVLHQALEENPESGLTRALYARALDALGDPQAIAESEIALGQRAGLPRREQLETEAHAAFIERRFVEASELFGSLHYFDPDDQDLSDAWAESLIAAGDWQRALGLLDQWAGKDDPLGFGELLLVARAAGAGQKYERQLEAAEHASREALGRGALAAAAQAEIEQSRALTGLRKLARGEKLAQSAENRFRGQNLLRGVLDALEQRARIADLEGRLEKAEALRKEADELAEKERRAHDSADGARAR